MRNDKESVIKFLKTVTSGLNQTVTDMKMSFEEKPCLPKEIKSTLLSWKDRYSGIVAMSLKEHIFSNQVEPPSFNFKSYMGKIISDFNQEPDLMDQLRSLNLTIQRLKEFIRESLVKDPSIFQV